MKRHAWISTLLLVVLLLFAVGCGGGKDGGTGQTTPSPPSSPASTPVQQPSQDSTPSPAASGTQPSQVFGKTDMFEVVDEKFVLPETDDLVKIKQFANMLTKSEPELENMDSEGWQRFFKLQCQYFKAMYDTGVKIYDHPDATEKDKANALKIQAKGLTKIAGYDSDAYMDKLHQLAGQLEVGEDTKKIAISCWASYHQIKLGETAGSDDEAFRASLDEVLAFVETNKNETAISTLVGFLSSFLAYNRHEEIAETYTTKLQDILKTSNQSMYKSMAKNIPQMREQAKAFQQRQAEQERNDMLASLPGNTMELECILLNGDKLNLKDLEGKVVLVDFWASWCPPCRAEVPGMLAAYEKYHDQGFEIIGYNVDWDNGEDVAFLTKYVEDENIPWFIASAPACEEAGLVNYAKYYGVRSIPRMILIGKDGKVISVSARGQALTKELKMIFGN